MFKPLFVGALLFCCGLVSGQHFHSVRCPQSVGKYPFDEQKFSGDWYSVANAFRPNEFSGKFVCDKIHVTAETVGNVTKTHFDVLIKKADGTEQNVEGRGRAFKPEVASTTSMSFRFTKDDIWHDVIKYSIIATDYDTYALVHGCKEHYDAETDEFYIVIFNHIWSRSKTLDEGVMKTLKSVFSSFEVFEDEWIDVDNYAC